MAVHLPLELHTLLFSALRSKFRPCVHTATSHQSRRTLSASLSRRRGRQLGKFPSSLYAAPVTQETNRDASHEPFLSLATDASSPSLQSVPPPAERPSLTKNPTPAEVTSPVAQAVPAALNTLHGVEIPTKPKPPASDECCMSGCATCVYDLYAAAMETYEGDLLNARSLLKKKGVPQDQWPSELVEAGEDGRSPRKKAQEHVDDELSLLDASMRAFLEMEKGIKKRRLGV